MEQKIRPKIGIAVYFLDKQGQLLMTLRKNVTGAGMWCPPGGHLEMGEEFLDCVKRESLEEVNIVVDDAKLWAVNNNIMSPDRHYVNLDFVATKWHGEAKNMEPEKCEKISWFALNNLPNKLLEPTQKFLSSNPDCICGSGKKINDCHGK